MYKLADRSFESQPKIMTRETLDAILSWTKVYLSTQNIESFHFSLHGGEPLLAGKELITFFLIQTQRLRKEVNKRITVSIVSNGLLIDNEWLSIFTYYQVGLTISIDGPKSYHDYSRKNFKGEGTHFQVESKIVEILQSVNGKKCFSGALCVIHPQMSGAELIRYFSNLNVPSVDFLLPDQNFLHNCPGYPKPEKFPTYGEVLVDAYIEWRRLGCKIYVRKFIELLRERNREQITLDSLGDGPIQVFTIETSGEVEPVDSLKCCGDSFTKSGLKIHEVTVEDVYNISLVDAGFNKNKILCKICKECRHQRSCGGGYLPHRYSSNGFDNPSIYCSDLAYLCDFIIADTRDWNTKNDVI